MQRSQTLNTPKDIMEIFNTFLLALMFSSFHTSLQ